jgi:hypothetical protein
MILSDRLIGQYRRWVIGLLAVPASLAVLAASSLAPPADAATRPPAPAARSHTHPHPASAHPAAHPASVHPHPASAHPAAHPHPAPAAHAHSAAHPHPHPHAHPAPPVRPAPRIPYTLPPSVPTWIRIPSIAVSAPVKPMGLLHDGYIQVPPLVPHSNLVGWYKYSPLPGELGPSVLVGHRDSDGVAVFFLLGDLVRGAKIYIDRADDSTAIFTVTRVRNFEKSTFPSVLVYGPTEYSALRVITCGGVFNYAIGSYEQNIVVYATLTGLREPHRRTPRVIPPAKPRALPRHEPHAAHLRPLAKLSGNKLKALDVRPKHRPSPARGATGSAKGLTSPVRVKARTQTRITVLAGVRARTRTPGTWLTPIRGGRPLRAR